MSLKSQDTIVAIATATGVGAIGIIRISGQHAKTLAESLFTPSKQNFPLQPRMMVHGWVKDQDQVLDEGMLCLMSAPHSYTGEDTAEFYTHGSQAVLNALLEACVSRGARLAEAGEFTRRAFFNGKMDLLQVEAVGDLLHARSSLSMQTAVNQMRGRLSQCIESISNQIKRASSFLEFSIDFADQDEDFPSRKECLQCLLDAKTELDKLQATAKHGQTIREGFRVALIGEPNVGKSSLLNVLTSRKRALVDAVAGTTRDFIEEWTSFCGLSVCLVDTAGVRQTENRTESAGVQLSLEELKRADLCLIIFAHDQKPTADVLKFLKPEKDLIVWNKKDLQQDALSKSKQDALSKNALHVSALSGEGIEGLKTAIFQKALGTSAPQESVLMTNLRQAQIAQATSQRLQNAIDAIHAGVGEECVAVETASALKLLGDIVGQTTADDILEQIFAHFCIGK